MIATIPPFPADPGQRPLDTPISLDLVIDQHGPWRVLRAALFALLKGPERRPLPLNAHIRRDIGLPDLPRGPTHWPGP